MHRRLDQPHGLRTRLAPALAVLLVATVAACSAGGSECEPSRVFEAEAGPDDEVGVASPHAPEVGETRLLHDEGGYAYFLVEQPDAPGSLCVWIEHDAEYLLSACGGPRVTTTSDDPEHVVGATYDARGDVELEAPSDWRVVDSCLAIRA
ncbi:hypothetical protein [Cellulosimicrobium cellulans]|uniref:hypothetical protein n=1 Tax=Cellulosimicrobium cellulans TaxID=1710 RepID=UPI0008489BD4|nr:hypothetical protein [Cellulosimicrobium cellulans]